jgi:putative ABC transport system permease protein
MRLSGIAHLYKFRLQQRSVLVQEFLAIAGIAVGVALLFASQIAASSLNGSVQQLTTGIIGNSKFQIEARTSNGFNESLLTQIQHLPNIRAAIPVLEERANLVGPAGHESVDLIATDPRFAHFGGTLLKRFSAQAIAHQRAIALPAPVSNSIGGGPLQGVSVEYGSLATKSLVAAVLEERNIGPLVHSQIAIAPLAYAQQLTGMKGRLTRVLVRPAPGQQAQVEHELEGIAAEGRLDVRPADFDSVLFSEAATPINQSTGTFSAVSAFVGFLFAFNAMLLTIGLRRELISGLRMDGATRWETIKVLLVDALVLGGIASILGLVLGDVLSATFFHASPGYLSFGFPIGNQRIVTWQNVAVAVAGGLVASCVGVFAPIRDIFPHPLSIPATAKPHTRRTVTTLSVAGLSCLLVTTIILVAAPGSAIVGIVTLVLALLLLLPLWLGGIIFALGAHIERLARPGASSYIAAEEVRSPDTRARSLAIAATGAIAVFGASMIQGAQSNLQHGLNRLFHDVTSVTNIWIAPPGTPNLLATTSFADTISPRLEHLPGVVSIGLYRSSFFDFDTRRVWVLAPPATAKNPVPPRQLLSGDLTQATARLRAGGWAVVSKAIAQEHHLHIGQSFTLPAANPITLRVAALTTNLGWPSGAIVLNSNDYANAWGTLNPSALNVTVAPTTPAAQVRNEIARTLGHTGLAIETSQQREQRQRTASHEGLARLTQISILVLVAGILAIAVAMSAMIWQRRDRLAGLKMDGLTTNTLWLSLIYETAILLGAGCTLGAALGTYGQLLLSHALLTVTGFPIVFSVNAPITLASTAIVITTSATIVAIAGNRAAHTPQQPATNPT